MKREKQQPSIKRSSMSSVSKLPRLINTCKGHLDLWNDSSSDLSFATDPHHASLRQRTPSFHRNSSEECCLICSILASLSTINCCTKHLTLLTTNSPSMSNTHRTSCSSFNTHHRPKAEKFRRNERKKSSLFLQAFVRPLCFSFQ